MLYRISKRCDSSEFIRTIVKRHAILPSGYIPAILVTDQMPNLDNGIFGTMFDTSNIVNLSSQSKEVLPATDFTIITLCNNTSLNITKDSWDYKYAIQKKIFYCVIYLHTKGVKMTKIDYCDIDSDIALLQFCLRQNYTLAVETKKEAMRLSSLLLTLLQKEEYKNSDKMEYPILIVNKSIAKDTILIPAVVANRLENIIYRTSVCKAWYTHIVPRNIAFDENTLFFYRGMGFTLDGFTTMIQDNEIFCDFIKNRRTD